MRASLVAVITVVLAAASLNAGATKPLSDVPTYLWFGNASTDALRSDGRTVIVNGIVADYADGFENVATWVQTTGNFRFTTSSNTRKAATRAVCVDFGTQFQDSGAVVPFTNGLTIQCVDILEAMHSYPVGDVAIQNLRYGLSVQKLVRFTWVALN